MAILNNNPLVGASGNQGGYNINNSLRFRSSASAYLSRTPASTGSRQTFTYSFWMKRGTLGTLQRFFGVSDNATGDFIFQWTTSNTLEIYDNGPAGTSLITTQVFRDPSAWYHIVITYDTTNATSSNRVRVYVNGSQVTAFGTAVYPAQNTNSFNNQASIPARIGIWPSGSQYFDGYFAEFNFIDGSAKAASDFGETDTTTGVWKPKAYTGTYGTNGFYLKFSDIATTSGSNAGLGKDFSGNSNYWTTNNISVTSGTTYDAMTDVPTNTSATVANYAVLDPLDPTTSGNMTLSNANLTMTTSAANRSRLSTIYVPSGKWYAEVTFTTASGSLSGCMVGLCRSEDATSVVASYLGSSTNSYGYNQGGDKYNAGSATAYGASYTTSDIIGIAFDADAGTVTFYKNNTSQGTAFTGLSTSSLWSIGVSSGISSTSQNIVSNINFGQRPFQYSAPSGFLPLNTYNLPTPTILQGNKYMDATTYTGTGTTNVVVNQAQFKPDFVWIKNRTTGSQDHGLFDSIRGATKTLYSDLTNAEATVAGNLTAFNSNGFSVGSENMVNQSTANMIGWQWQAGQGSTSSNTSGSITSTVSVNTTAGFSIATFTGASTQGATFGHGLGVAPKMVIAKSKTGSTQNWWVYHTSLGYANNILLNSTAAAAADGNTWRATPSSTLVTIGDNFASSATYVAYCWAEIAGFSKFGSYTGNGSTDGVFVYLGFRPKFIITKVYSTSGYNWNMYDSSRGTYNVADQVLIANGSGAEETGFDPIDFLSNGFKLRMGNRGSNVSGASYIYMAFAENPFKNSLAR